MHLNDYQYITVWSILTSTTKNQLFCPPIIPQLITHLCTIKMPFLEYFRSYLDPPNDILSMYRLSKIWPILSNSIYYEDSCTSRVLKTLWNIQEAIFISNKEEAIYGQMFANSCSSRTNHVCISCSNLEETICKYSLRLFANIHLHTIVLFWSSTLTNSNQTPTNSNSNTNQS